MGDIENKDSIQTDVAIIGGGGAGLTAAIAAKKGGIKNVLVLEKIDILGGNTRISHGILAVNSPAQKRYIDESLRLHYPDSAGTALCRQPDKTCYALLDSGMLDYLKENREPLCGLEKDMGRSQGKTLQDIFSAKYNRRMLKF